MRSLSSSEVICNISMRWRNCGVSTSRWERLVVSLRDIPQIRCLYVLRLFGLSRLPAAREDYNRSLAFSVQSLCSLCLGGWFRLTIFTTEARRTQRLHRDLKNRSHAKLFAQVKPAHFCVFGKLAWVSGAEDFALRHYICAVRYAKSFAHVVIGNEYPDTTISQVEYYILNIIHCFRIDTRERLVQQDVLRLGSQSSCYFSAPAFAT